MPAQPNKYPRPKDPAFLSDWQNGYDCKKCGSEFVVKEVAPKKSGGCLKLILGTIIFLFAAYGAYHFFFNKTNEKTNTQTTASQQPASEPVDVASQKLVPISTSIPEPQTQETTPASTVVVSQAFLKGSDEGSAYGYKPNGSDYKHSDQPAQQSIADSSDPNKTLQISTTIRKSN